MGRMGQAVRSVAAERQWPIAAELTAADLRSPEQALARAQVAIEFTTPAAAVANIRLCLAAGCPVVVGTTGWYEQLPSIADEVERENGAVLWSANFSLAANVLITVATQTARLLAAAGRRAYDVAIVETHHATKRDAPSGTARAIAQELIEERGGGVPITSVRLGHVPGIHEVLFDGAYDQLRLTHTARDRRVFAEGALLAAQWLVGKRGLFTMRDVLGLGEDV